MSIRLAYLKVAEKARKLSGPSFADIRHKLTVRKRTWSGDYVGDGTSSDEDLVLPPHYPIRPLTQQEVYSANGQYILGDIYVNHITPSDGAGTGYTKEQLNPTITTNKVDVIYIVTDTDGEINGEYTCIDFQKYRPFSIRLVLRRRSSPP